MRWVVIGGVVLLAGVAVYLLVRPDHSKDRHARFSPSEEQVADKQRMDVSMSPMLAMFRAPEGATLCESTYNAYKAFDDAGGPQSGPQRTWGRLPALDVFLARCGKLSELEQQCLQPRYWAHNKQACSAVNIDGLVKGLFDAP